MAEQDGLEAEVLKLQARKGFRGGVACEVHLQGAETAAWQLQVLDGCL